MKKEISPLAAYIKYKRTEYKLSQKDLSEKAGLGIRFIRDLEQGKQTLRLDKINHLLSMFGHEMRPQRSGIDRYVILTTYLNKDVSVTLKTNEKIQGVIIPDFLNEENITTWTLVKSKRKKEYKKTKNKDLTIQIMHENIHRIEHDLD
jgi:y4mF family transcriptional regulator